jgi:hypothetical protein
VVLGLSIAVGWAIYARVETSSRSRAADYAIERQISSGYGVRWLPSDEGLDPMPGVYIGVAIALTGILVVAMPRGRA